VYQDAYVRLSPHGALVVGQPIGPGNLLFVDVMRDVPISELRRLPFNVFRDASRILVRSRAGYRRRDGLRRRLPRAVAYQLDRWRWSRLDGGTAARATRSSLLMDLEQQVHRGGLQCSFGVLHQPLGQEPWIESDDDWPRAYIDRARAVEIESLLRHAGAVWQPDGYHYLLPSGEHAPGFVRTANAIRTPRDAGVLASWLRQHARPGLGMVLDTGTLTPVALALEAGMRADGIPIGPVEVLDHYPSTSYDVFRAVRAAQRENAVLALLSVSSSGRVRDHLIQAMRALETTLDSPRALRVVEVLVSKQSVERPEERWGKARLRTWHPRPGDEPIIPAGSGHAEACAECRSDDRSLLVPIDPDTFEAVFPASVTRMMPSLTDARRNRPLWEACDGTDAISLEDRPRPGVEMFRPLGQMPIRVDLERLFSSERFRASAADVVRGEIDAMGASTAGIDTLLVLDDDHDKYAADFIDRIRPCFSDALEIARFPRDGAWGTALVETVKQASGIAILTKGTVTGTSIQRALVAAQRYRQPGEQITGIIGYARLNDKRAWETLENSFARRLVCAFHGYLGHRSPLQSERATLDNLTNSSGLSALSAAAREFFDRRGEFCSAPEGSPGEGLFWGASSNDRLTPNSIFGQGLRPRATYVGVASAMERSRQEAEAKAAPARYVFDMPAIVRSYYDPLILSAIIRWLEPSEQWWGENDADVEGVIHDMMRRSGSERLVLVPELLLASAQGKVAPAALRAVVAYAETLRGSSDFSAAELAPVELGLLLAPSGQ
jgi:hypothetical protein